VGPTEAPIAGGNNLLMARAATQLGLPGKVIQRNARGCEGNGRCLQGCPVGARQSMEVSYVPRAIERGARLVTDCHVERVLLERGRAVGVRGLVRDASGSRRIEIGARRGVIVAASAIFSPLLLARSGVRHPLLGERFQAHPGAAIVGRFDEDVCMGFGASQGYEVPMRERGYKLEALSLPPDMLAARLPGAGRDWQARVGELGRYAQWGGVVRMEALGRVRAGLFDGVSVRYEPTRADLAKVRDALLLVGRMMFAAGAQEIYPGIASMPEIVRSEAELVARMPAELARPDVHLVASHLFGTTCVSADPSRGVVDEQLAVRGARDLYVMDASVFPTNLGVNPQHSIMGVVWAASKALAAREHARRAA
jgi:choline dehydrogenase-like flavoprotein